MFNYDYLVDTKKFVTRDAELSHLRDVFGDIGFNTNNRVDLHKALLAVDKDIEILIIHSHFTDPLHSISADRMINMFLDAAKHNFHLKIYFRRSIHIH